jgi:hypothetical protein
LKRFSHNLQNCKIHKNSGSNEQWTETIPGTKTHSVTSLENFGLTNQSYTTAAKDVQKEIHAKNSMLYQMESQKKCDKVTSLCLTKYYAMKM